MTNYDDELDDFMIEKLKLMEQTPPRNPVRAHQGRSEFVRQIRYLQLGRPVFSIANFLDSLRRRLSFSQRRSAVPFAAALLLIFGLVLASWGTVYAAQNSLPNDFLYIVKQTGEDLRLAFTTDADARISLLTTYSDRRVTEAKTLVLQGEMIPEALSERLDQQYDALFATTATLEEEEMLDALKGIQIHLRDQDQDMTNAMNGIPEDLDPQLVQLRSMMKARQQLAQMGDGEPNTFQHRYQNRENATHPITTTLTVTPTITSTPNITVTLTITPGHYGPGPCETPGECEPPGYGQGPFEGTPPVPEDDPGYGPGEPGNGSGPSQPTATPTPYEPPQEPPSAPPGEKGGTVTDVKDAPKESGSKKGAP